MTKPVVFVHTNDQQMLGAKLSAYSLRKYSRHADAFDIRLLRLEDTAHLYGREGQPYLWMGKMVPWHNADLQSFTPLRRMVPQLMQFQGRALVIDPDVFSVGGDVFELLSSEMNGKALFCRNLPDIKGGGAGKWASSVMLMDCARLTHWRWDEQIDAMFEGTLDYKPWIQLVGESPDSIGALPDVWNSFDTLNADTRLLHMTERLTQPWKTGLPIDYNINIRSRTGRLKKRLRDRGWLPAQRFQKHPDPRQEAFFFTLLKEGLESGVVTADFLRQSVAARHVRADAFDVLATLGYREAAT